jgi:hypothetical protein
MLTRPDLVLRLEAFTVLLAGIICYSVALHGHWLLFTALFLAPDLALLGYLVKGYPRFAATLYNSAHTYVVPALLALAAWKASIPYGAQIAVIWIIHIAFDRLLGFGLKYPEAFKPTHIQTVAVFHQSNR